MSDKTKSIGINFSGYPYSSSHFIVDNGGLLLIDSLLKNGHHTIFFDFNIASTIDKLSISEDLKTELNQQVKRIMDSGSAVNPDQIDILNKIEKHVEDARAQKIHLISKDLINYCKKNEIQFIWFKLWTGDGFKYSEQIAKEIKKEIPEIITVGGGHHARLFRESIFEISEGFDIISYGEGEKILPMIADYVAGKREIDSIPGIIYKKDNEIIDTKGNFFSSPDELNSYLVPKDFMSHYLPYYPALKEKIIIGLTETSRGCPNDHPYCQHWINSGNHWRLLDPDVVVENIRRLNDNNIFVNRIADSNPPGSHQKTIYQLLKARGITKNLITAFCEIPQFDEELGRLFKEVGGFSYFFGVESGCDPILSNLRKKYSIEEAIKKVHIAKKQGIKVVASVMVPTIGDTPKTIEITKDNIIRMNPDYCPILPTVPMAEMLTNLKWFGYSSGENYNSEFQMYSPKLHLPPQLGSSLPIRMGEWSWNQMKAISGKVAVQLEKAGIPTVISDETLLLAHLAGEDAQVFNKRFGELLREGRTSGVQEYIDRINERVKKPF